MTPASPFFKSRFKVALNRRIKKEFDKAPDYTKTDVQTKLQAIALTVLQDVGVKDYSVLVGIRPTKGGKAEMGFNFVKTKK